jgi:prolyl-tRNA synthetase
VTFQTSEGGLDHVWATSWGMSTRLIGALIMTHSDDKGLVVPPKLAPIEAVIVPIFRKDNVADVAAYAKTLGNDLRAAGIKVETDLDETASSGWKFAEWELVGVPVRIEAGPKDMEKDQAVLVRRDTGEKLFVARADVPAKVKELLADIQKSLYDRALKNRLDNTFPVDTWPEFLKLMEGDGGFVEAAWCGDAKCEAGVKETTKATIRNLPFALKDKPVNKACVKCGSPGKHWAIWAKSY